MLWSHARVRQLILLMHVVIPKIDRPDNTLSHVCILKGIHLGTGQFLGRPKIFLLPGLLHHFALSLLLSTNGPSFQPLPNHRCNGDPLTNIVVLRETLHEFFGVLNQFGFVQRCLAIVTAERDSGAKRTRHRVRTFHRGKP